eukprot:scaffold16272_cov71-Cylindrotheca_fusiformis.AAC.1
MLATSYPVFDQQQSGVIQEARKLVLSDARNIFCTFVRSQQYDEAAQELIMIFGDPCKRPSCTSLSGNVKSIMRRRQEQQEQEGLNHGVFGSRRRCSALSGDCRKCGRPLRWTQGIFCTNSFHSVGGFPPCHGVWCGSCYSLDSSSAGFFSQADDREVHRLVGDNPTTNLWGPKAPDLKQFDEARPGDHLLSPFVCHICIFRILRGVNADPTHRMDDRLVQLIMRANLDVFWSRTRSTVKTNRGTVDRALTGLVDVGLQGPFYDPGPTPY